MSNKYWKNVLDHSLENSEIFKDFQQISSKIDDYYKSFPISTNISACVPINRTEKKSFTYNDKNKRPASSTKPKRYSIQNRNSTFVSEQGSFQDSYQTRTLTYQNRTNSRYSYPKGQSVAQSKQVLFKGL